MTEIKEGCRQRVALVTDSSACLPEDQISRHKITVVPTVLVWDGQELRDAVDISNEEFWRRLAWDPVLPSTSTMSPYAYVSAFSTARQIGDSVLCAVIPSRMSSMADVARAAICLYKDDRDVTVVETGAAAMAHGFPVLLGARAASAGADASHVEDVVRRAADASAIVAVVDSLKYLARSGRIPRLVARTANVLPASVIFSKRRGRIRAWPSFGSRARAIQGMITYVRRVATKSNYLGVAVHHAANVSEGHELAELVRTELRPDDLFVTGFTPVMGAHVGPRVLGLSYCSRPDI